MIPDIAGLSWSNVRAMAREMAAGEQIEGLVDAETAGWNHDDPRQAFTYQRVLARR